MVTYDEDFDTTSTRVGEEKYTNFSTVGNEAEKIKMMILYHVVSLLIIKIKVI
jgi:hypothetical protein